MRPFSLYLDSVKNTKAPACEFDLSGSTPPIPIGLSKTVAFEAAESRKSEAQASVTKLLSEITGAPENRLLTTVGSSSAFLLALAAVTKPGDTVVIEKPTYEPFVQTALFLGLKIKRFKRTGEFEKDLANLRKIRGHVLVISNPNSPAGWLYSAQELAALAERFNHIVVDEIFLPLFANEISRAPSDAIALSGMSKTLGLSSLRVGWISASPKILRACDQLGLNLYCDVPTLPLVAAAEILPRWSAIVSSHRARAEKNRPLVRAFHSENHGCLSHDFSQGHFGTLTVPRKFKTAASFAKELARKSVKVAPGEAFESPSSVRFSIGVDADKFQRAFKIIGSYY